MAKRPLGGLLLDTQLISENVREPPLWGYDHICA